MGEGEVVKLVIAGARNIKNEAAVFKAIDQFVRDTGEKVEVVVSGGARGPDRMGEQWAAREGLDTRIFPAAFSYYGRKAGPMRNEDMANFGTHLIAFWDGDSNGTFDVIERFRMKGKRYRVCVMGVGKNDAITKIEEGNK